MTVQESPSSVDANAVDLVVRFIRSLGDFQLSDSGAGYPHMGALLTDAVLQGGIRYATVVEPRVRAVKARGEARTTSGFIRLLETEGSTSVLRWKGAKKLGTLWALSTLLQANHVETIEDLRGWLQRECSNSVLQKIRGVGPKTVDYLMILAGHQTVAVDVHLLRFLEEAGVPAMSYDEARAILMAVAIKLEITPAALDHSIWRYMSTRNKGERSDVYPAPGPCSKGS